MKLLSVTLISTLVSLTSWGSLTPEAKRNVWDVGAALSFYTGNQLYDKDFTFIPDSKLSELVFNQAIFERGLGATIEYCENCDSADEKNFVFENLSFVKPEGVPTTLVRIGSAAYGDWLGTQIENKCFTELQDPQSYIRTRSPLPADASLDTALTLLKRSLQQNCQISDIRNATLIPQIVMYQMSRNPQNWKRVLNKYLAGTNINFQDFFLKEFVKTFGRNIAPLSRPKGNEGDTVLKTLRGESKQNGALVALSLLEAMNGKPWSLGISQDNKTFAFYESGSNASKHLIYGSSQLPDPSAAYNSNGSRQRRISNAALETMRSTIDGQRKRSTVRRTLLVDPDGNTRQAFSGVVEDEDTGEPTAFSVIFSPEFKNDVKQGFKDFKDFVNQTVPLDDDGKFKFRSTFRPKGFGASASAAVEYSEGRFNSTVGVRGSTRLRGFKPSAGGEAFANASYSFEDPYGDNSYLSLFANADVGMEVYSPWDFTVTTGYNTGKTFKDDSCEYNLTSSGFNSLSRGNNRTAARAGADASCEIFTGTDANVSYSFEFDDVNGNRSLGHVVAAGVTHEFNKQWKGSVAAAAVVNQPLGGGDISSRYSITSLLKYKSSDGDLEAYGGAGVSGPLDDLDYYVTAGAKVKVPYLPDTQAWAGGTVYGDAEAVVGAGIDTTFEVPGAGQIDLSTGVLLPIGQNANHRGLVGSNRRFFTDAALYSESDTFMGNSLRQLRGGRSESKPQGYVQIRPHECVEILFGVFDACGDALVKFDGTDAEVGGRLTLNF